MTKQEEIRKGLISLFYEMGLGETIDSETFQRKILEYLHFQGLRLPDGEPLIENGEENGEEKETTPCLYWHYYSCSKGKFVGLMRGLFDCGCAGTMERRECYKSRDEIQEE